MVNDSKNDDGGRGSAGGLMAELGHMLGVFGEGSGEDSVTCAGADEVEEVGLRGMLHGAQGGQAGIADGARGETRVAVGVVGRVGLQIRGVDGAAEAVFEQSGIDDRGIGLERHAADEPVLKDAGDERTFIALSYFFFDDGGEDDGTEGVAAGAELGRLLAESLHHDAEHLHARGVAREAVGVWEEEAFKRLRTLAGDKVCDELGVGTFGLEEVWCGAETGGGDGLCDVEDVVALGDYEASSVDITASEPVVDLKGGGGMVKAVLSGADPAALQDAKQIEGVSVADDAAFFK